MKYVKLFEEFEEIELGGYSGYRKGFDQSYSFDNKFKNTSKEEMMTIHGENIPEELYNIILEFSGKHYSFGITKDNGKYIVYKWRSIFELTNIGECDTLEKAKNLVNENNK